MGIKFSSQAPIQNMCLLLNMSIFHNNEMAPSQTKHRPTGPAFPQQLTAACLAVNAALCVILHECLRTYVSVRTDRDKK